MILKIEIPAEHMPAYLEDKADFEMHFGGKITHDVFCTSIVVFVLTRFDNKPAQLNLNFPPPVTDGSKERE